MAIQSNNENPLRVEEKVSLDKRLLVDKKIKLVKPDYSTVMFKPFLHYLKDRVGLEQARQMVSETGLDWDYLIKESNWVSEDYADIFYSKMETLNLPENFSYEASKLIFTPQLQGVFVLMAMKLFGPYFIYKNLLKISQTFNRADNMVVEKIRPGHMKAKFLSRRQTPHMRHIANSWIAPFEDVPTLYNLAKANVQYEIKDKEIAFDVTWEPLGGKHFLAIAGRMLAGVLGIAGFFFLFKQIMFGAIGAFTGMILSLLWAKMTDKTLKKREVHSYAQLQHFLEESRQKNIELHEAVLKLDRRYKEANLLSGIIKRISESQNIYRLIEITMEEIHESLKFDRVIFFLQEGDFLQVKGAKGFNSQFMPHVLNYKLDLKEETANPAHLGNIYKNRDSILVPTTKEYFASLSDRGKHLIKESGSQSFLAVTIANADQSFGVLLVDYVRSDKQVTKDDLHIIKNMANQLALSFSHLFQLERERFIRNEFQSFVPKEMVEQIVSKQQVSNDPNGLTHELYRRHHITSLFADIRNYTTLAEKKKTAADEEKLCLAMNYYFERMAEIIYQHKGIVDKHIGDAIFALFNAFNNDQDTHQESAISSAYQMLQAMNDVNESIRQQIDPTWEDIKIGISLHSGLATLGNFGSKHKKEFTAMGNTINITSRVEGLCKFFGESVILLTEDLRMNAEKNFELEMLGDHQLKGMEHSKCLYKMIKKR